MTPDGVIDAALDESLHAGLAELSIPLERDARAALLAYVALLAKWNRTYNLTAIRDRKKNREPSRAPGSK